MTKKAEILQKYKFALKTARYGCIDTAPINMGYCTRSLTSDDFWNPMQLNITCTKQGFVYHDIEENNICEMVSRFGEDHAKMFRGLDFVIAEKAVNDNVIRKSKDWNWSRARCVSNTVKVELALRMLFMNKPGFPPIIIKPAGWWREATGVKAPNTGNLTPEAAYKANKQISIDAFIARFGEPRYKLLCETQIGNQAEDIIESYWLGEAVKIKWDEIQLELLSVNNYDAMLFPTPRNRITAEERFGAWQEYPQHEIDTLKSRLEKYEAYKKSRKQKKIKKKEDTPKQTRVDKILKKLEKRKKKNDD